MAHSSFKCLALLGSMLIGAVSAVAQDSGPLIDLLVKKGIVNDQEAEDLRAELVKDFSSSSAGKVNLGATLTELRISGDVRARFEDRTGELPTGDHLERDRFRYRFRTSLTGKVLNDWTFGIRLETASGNRSSNVTMGDDGGPFAKTSDGIFVGQIYMNWAPTPAFNLTIGRMPNPLVTTPMIWDADINPEGLAESYKFRQGNDEFSATLGQFLYAAASTQNAFGNTPNVKDLYLFAWQGGYKHYIEGATTFFQVNPTIYNYVRADQNNNPAAAKGVFTAANPTAINNLFILDVPIEFDWMLHGVPARVFGDFAYNFDGKARADKFGRPDLENQRKAYTVGFQYNKAVNKGEWDAKAYYQDVQAFALDSSLVDSDIFDSRVNMKGFALSGNYALGAATQLTVTLANGRRSDDSLIAPGAGDIGSNNALNRYWLTQIDLNIKY